MGGRDMISGFKVGTDQVALYGYDAGARQQVSSGATVLSLSDGTSITLLNANSVV